ncbi:MAG: rane protein of unknown function [Candidatus Saccharibacteria bacterium]|nr:rane protein of unknown function [Candidatus Saccharibacteria bacterium]
MLNIVKLVGARTRHSAILVVGVVSLAILLPVATSAQTTISQGYSTSDTLSVGSLVSLKDGTSDQVVGTSSSNVNSLLGVIINSDSSLLTVSNGSANQVQVATNGVASVLVSDMNGAIVKGDQITASPIKGVGMKATNNAKVVGIAQDGPANSNSTQTYTDNEGKKQKVTLGEVPIVVNVTYFYAQPDKTLIPAAIQNLANALAGKTVNSLPIIISGVIFIITIIIVVSIIYSMIRSSIISVGRNPMAQSAVYRDVIQLSALVLGILAVAVIAIYVILTRF